MYVSFGHCITFQILKSDWALLLTLHIAFYVAVITENPVSLRFDFIVGTAV